MTDSKFIGRKKELDILQSLRSTKLGKLVVITGRRRIGKSRLIKEFAQNGETISITGLPPEEETTAQSQRDEFTRQLSAKIDMPLGQTNDWGDTFTLLAKLTEKKKIIIIFDEISWMGSKDHLFLGKLKVVWDMHFSENPNLILILCGSISSWIEKNIMMSTGFFGRIYQRITLKPLSLKESNELLTTNNVKGSPYEKFMILSMTGGVPWYLELIQPGIPATENLKRLCFSMTGSLVNEFENIFHDLFSRRGPIYQKIVEALAKGPLEHDEIANKINYTAGGKLSEYLDELTQAGFISRDYTWHIDNGVYGKLNRFRLKDNYLRFFIRFIKPNLNLIEQDKFDSISLSSMNNFASTMGLQFENLVLQNTHAIFKLLNLELNDLEIDGAFFQRKTQRVKGCQVDYMIQTKQKVLYLIEIKFHQGNISTAIFPEIQKKLDALKVPKNYAVLPVLIHVNGVDEAVQYGDFFHRVIDFSELLEID